MNIDKSHIKIRKDFGKALMACLYTHASYPCGFSLVLSNVNVGEGGWGGGGGGQVLFIKCRD